MNTKSIFLLFALALTLITFQRCNTDEAISPANSVASESLFKVVKIAEDQNLQTALDQLLVQDSTAHIFSKMGLYTHTAIVGRDLNLNLVHYTIPLFNEESPGFQNLVITLTPSKESYARIFSYVSSDPKAQFESMDTFVGELVVSDLNGKQLSRSLLSNGKARSNSASNAKEAGCVTTTHYTTVTTPYGSHTKVAFVETNCSNNLPTVGGSGSTGAEYGTGTGGGVAVTPAGSGSHQVLGSLCEGKINFKHHAGKGGAFSATVSNVGGTYYNTTNAQIIEANIGIVCVSIPEYKLSNNYEASDEFTRIVNFARYQVYRNLQSGLIQNTQYHVTKELEKIIRNELQDDFPGATLSKSSCSGNIPHTILDGTDYGC